MSKFALLGNGPLSNRGCEAIVLGTVNIIEREFGTSDFLLASFAEDSTDELPNNIRPLHLPFRIDRWSLGWWQYRFNRLLGQPENKSNFLKRLEGNLGDVDVAFSIGGDGYAIEYGHQIIDRLIIMNDYIKSKGIPVVIWGASIGPFDKEPEFEKRIAEHFSNLDLIVVREPISLDYLKNLGVIDNVYLAPDPAFALTAVECSLLLDVEKILQNDCLGLNLSPLMARFATLNNFEDWETTAVDIVERLITDIGLPIILVPHTTFENHRPEMDDELFLSRVFGKITPVLLDQVAILPRGLSSQNLKWVIGQTNIFIGARTHSTIAALSSCIPCLSIAYSRKAWGINELIFGHHEWVYSSEQLDSEELTKQVKNLLQARDRVRSYLNDVIPTRMIETFAAAKKIKELIS